MTDPDGPAFGDDTPEADVVEQLIPVETTDGDEDTWREAERVTAAREWEASEADLVDQAIEVPLPDDELDFDR
jgi:hypothetical protein